MLRANGKEALTTQLDQYTPSPFLVKKTEISIDLTTTPVTAASVLYLTINPDAQSAVTELTLDGENMDLESVRVNDMTLTPGDYTLTDKSLTIPQNKLPNTAVFCVATKTKLRKNTDLFGLYETNGMVLVKAESQGMRRMIYCLDRPDVQSSYEVTLIGDKAKHPVLLSNGVLTSDTILPDDKHIATWKDEVPKPTYLFAMVAGKLDKYEDSYVTKSGRKIPISLYADAASIQQCLFGIEIIKKSWDFDQQVFGVECDLPEHKLVGITQYAAGASETTTLNLFNLQYLAADVKTTTNRNFITTANTVSHEVFHGWSGNHVTIRDWFNLSLKEGLTTFRASLFLENLFGRTLIRTLFGKLPDEPRASRPDSYVSVRNLYSIAAYDKAAEIFRMIMLMMGEKNFYQAITNYFNRYKGQAVTLEDLLQTLSASAKLDLMTTMPWFTETGIVELAVTEKYDAENQQYSLTFKQSTPGKEHVKRPIPVVIGLLDPSGAEFEKDTLCLVEDDEQTFTFDFIPSKPVPSLLRSYSALVKLKYDYSREDLLDLMLKDSDFPNRRIAFNQYILMLVKDFCAGKPVEISDDLIDAYLKLLGEKSIDQWARSLAMDIASEEEMVDALGSANMVGIRTARNLIMTTLAEKLQTRLQAVLANLQATPDVINPQFPQFDIRNAGKRSMIYSCQKLLARVSPDDIADNLQKQFFATLGSNMNDVLTALTLLLELNEEAAQNAMNYFYTCYQSNTLAVNLWFGLQAGAHSNGVVDNVRKLMDHPAFNITIPNKVYSLFRPFIRNLYGFHAESGVGYELLREVILKVDAINPQVASVLFDAFVNWDKYDKSRQKMMYQQLLIMADSNISKDVREKLDAALKKGNPLQTSPVVLRSQLFVAPNAQQEQAKKAGPNLCHH